ASWELPGADVEVRAEDVIAAGRVDLVLLVGKDRVLGIEVKTREASTTPGQLERYRDGLRSKYPDRQLAIAFLTPFDRIRAGDAASSLQSIQEFDAFAATFAHSRHMSWLDVAEIDWAGGQLWAQHRKYVRTVISSGQSRIR